MKAEHRKTERDATEPVEIERDIEQTRSQLADTVETLASKANVPARVKEKAHETAQTVQSKTEPVIGKAKHVTDQAKAKVPPPVVEKAEQAVTTARRKPIPIAITTVAGLALLRRLRRRPR